MNNDKIFTHFENRANFDRRLKCVESALLSLKSLLEINQPDTGIREYSLKAVTEIHDQLCDVIEQGPDGEASPRYFEEGLFETPNGDLVTTCTPGASSFPGFDTSPIDIVGFKNGGKTILVRSAIREALVEDGEELQMGHQSWKCRPNLSGEYSIYTWRPKVGRYVKKGSNANTGERISKIGKYEAYRVWEF